jgi:hypothetical protein
MRIVPLAKQHGGAEFHSLLTKRKDLCNDSSLVSGKQSFGILPNATPEAAKSYGSANQMAEVLEP